MPSSPPAVPQNLSLDPITPTSEQYARRGCRPTPVRNARQPTLESQLACAEHVLAKLIEQPDLDRVIQRDGPARSCVDAAVESAIHHAYETTAGSAAAHTFLQRVLYRINRLMLFWFDDLRRYDNDRSAYLHGLRASIEHAWQAWELRQLPPSSLAVADVSDALRTRAAADVDPPPSRAGSWFRDHATLSAYRRLLAIASLDALVEASQLSRTLGGIGHPVHGTLTRLLLEEYGGGRLARKHSTYFRTMLEALGMETRPEAYFDLVPWEVLAGINHSFLLSDRRRHFLRYVGGLLHTETSVPAGFRCFLAAGRRLGLPPEATAYWELHIKEDARHGPWMLNDAALPLVERYPDDAWELVLGYDQQRAMSARAATATTHACAAVA